MDKHLSDLSYVLNRNILEDGRPDWNSYFLSVAILTSVRSSCHRIL